MWHVADEATTFVPIAPESYPVSIGALSDGAVLAAVRGRTPGVVRASVGGGAPTTVLSGVDPWCIATRADQVWVGTLGQGLWMSNDGGWTFTLVLAEASISALQVVGDDLWMGLRGGQIQDPAAGLEIGTVEPGWAVGFAAMEHGVLVLSAASYGPETLSQWDGTSLTPLPPPTVDDDPSQLNYTGIWPLPGGSVLVTFIKL